MLVVAPSRLTAQIFAKVGVKMRDDEHASPASCSKSAHRAGTRGEGSSGQGKQTWGQARTTLHPHPSTTQSPTSKHHDQPYPSPKRLVGLMETPAQAWKLARGISPSFDDVEATAKALMGADVHAQLSSAVRMGDAERATELLSDGVADASTRSRGTGVSLLTAAVCADDVAVARVLLLHGINPPPANPPQHSLPLTLVCVPSHLKRGLACPTTC